VQTQRRVEEEELAEVGQLHIDVAAQPSDEGALHCAGVAMVVEQVLQLVVERGGMRERRVAREGNPETRHGDTRSHG
jgi:hypothetical protein